MQLPSTRNVVTAALYAVAVALARRGRSCLLAGMAGLGVIKERRCWSRLLVDLREDLRGCCLPERASDQSEA